jgi:hypothetical protein
VVAYALLTAGGAAAQRGDPPARWYRNVDYEYVVRLPRGLRIETDPPPSPNHGFAAHLTPATLVWVTAEYETESVSTLAGEVEQMREALALGGCRLTADRPATLGGIPARDLTFACAAKSLREPATTERELMTIRTPPRRGLIVYHVGLRTPRDRRPSAAAERTFHALAEGLSFTSGHS